MDKALKDYLEKNKISYVVHNHPAVFTVEESRSLKKEIPGLHTKNLFLKDDKSRFYLVCMPAEKRLDIKLLRKYLQVNKLHFASPEELRSHLNLAPGSVSIFGMINAKSVKLVIDEDIWFADKVGFHPNVNTSTLEIKHADLERFYKSLKGDKEIIKI